MPSYYLCRIREFHIQASTTWVKYFLPYSILQWNFSMHVFQDACKNNKLWKLSSDLFQIFTINYPHLILCQMNVHSYTSWSPGVNWVSIQQNNNTFTFLYNDNPKDDISWSTLNSPVSHWISQGRLRCLWSLAFLRTRHPWVFPGILGHWAKFVFSVINPFFHVVRWK